MCFPNKSILDFNKYTLNLLLHIPIHNFCASLLMDVVILVYFAIYTAKIVIATAPLEASKVKKMDRGYFLVAISLERKVIPTSKTVINLPRTYEKLQCKGEPFRFSGYRNPSVQTDRHISCYFYVMINHIV